MSRCLFCCFDHSNKTSTKVEEIVVTYDDASSQKVDAVMGMDACDRKLVKETSDIVFNQMHIQDKSVTFLIEFFKRYPHHQRYFKMFRDVPPEELQTLPLLENHGRKVMDQMLKLVQNMEDPDSIQEQLSWISTKHKPRKVRSRQFKDMLSMFVEFTGQEMGSRFTAQHELAWQRWLAHILVVLEREESSCKSSLPNGSVTEHGQLATSTLGGDQGDQPRPSDAEQAALFTESAISLASGAETQPDSKVYAVQDETQAVLKGPDGAENANTNNSNTAVTIPENASETLTQSGDHTNVTLKVDSSQTKCDVSNSDQKSFNGVAENVAGAISIDGSVHAKINGSDDADKATPVENNTNNVENVPSDSAISSLSEITNNLKGKTEHDLTPSLRKEVAENEENSDKEKELGTSTVASTNKLQAAALAQDGMDRTLQNFTASDTPDGVAVERTSPAEVMEDVPQVVTDSKGSATPPGPGVEDSVSVRA